MASRSKRKQSGWRRYGGNVFVDVAEHQVVPWSKFSSDVWFLDLPGQVVSKVKTLCSWSQHFRQQFSPTVQLKFWFQHSSVQIQFVSKTSWNRCVYPTYTSAARYLPIYRWRHRRTRGSNRSRRETAAPYTSRIFPNWTHAFQRKWIQEALLQFIRRSLDPMACTVQVTGLSASPTSFSIWSAPWLLMVDIHWWSTPIVNLVVVFESSVSEPEDVANAIA